MEDFKACFSFRCFFPDGHSNDHYQELYLMDVPLWIQAYKFTHPGCVSISVKIWFPGKEAAADA